MTVGWLLVVGTVLSVPLGILAVFSLEPEEGTGVDSAMSHLIADGGIFVALAFLLGMIGVERVLHDGKSVAYLRQAGLVVLSLGLISEAISWTFTHLLTAHLDREQPASTSELFNTEGTLLVSFGVSFTLIGVGLFALGAMDVRLLGPDRALATVLGVVPAILGACLLLIALLGGGDAIGLYQLGSGVLLLQVIWVFLIGLAFIRTKQPADTGQETVGQPRS
ncbi:MAG: hypothetical protein F4Y40_05805 [Acidimicrobiia bacterium]|nr:hypothetical protein [Acidimicrobiia bacterium]MYF84291.1 hypothetical protein [Acidimicrobiia bacterium]